MASHVIDNLLLQNSFGFKLSVIVCELGRHLERLYLKSVKIFCAA